MFVFYCNYVNPACIAAIPNKRFSFSFFPFLGAPVHVSNFYTLDLKETRRRSASITCTSCPYIVMQQLARFWLTHGVARSVCDSRGFCWHKININRKLSNPRVVYFPTSPKQCPALGLPCEVEKHKNASFHLNVIAYFTKLQPVAAWFL